MNIDVAKDRLITHSMLNYLAASYQGWFSSLNLLAQLEHPDFDDAEVTRIQQALNSINQWMAQLYQDECLFSASWTTAETFEAKHALDLMEKLKPDLTRVAADTVRLVELQQLPTDPEARYLLAMLGRHAYSRDAYIRGFIEYGERFGMAAMSEKYGELLPQSDELINRVNQLLRQYRSSNLHVAEADQGFFILLHDSCRNLGPVFRTHLHDINQLLSPFKGGFSFQAGEFSKAEADHWQNSGFGPAQAGYWRAYGVEPAEARAWCDAKIQEVAAAMDWRQCGFNAEVAAPWAEQGFPPGYALMWMKAGFTAEKAREQIAAGVLEPPHAIAPPRA